jgi:hypothetical protein
MSARITASLFGAALAVIGTGAQAVECTSKDYSPYSAERECVNKYYKTLQFAMDLGSLLAYEGPCGFKFDPNAITKFITENTPADTLWFADKIRQSAEFQMIKFRDAPPSPNVLLASCAQAKITAKHYGFMKE